jgi:hypothetical protein
MVNEFKLKENFFRNQVWILIWTFFKNIILLFKLGITKSLFFRIRMLGTQKQNLNRNSKKINWIL